MKSAAVGRGLVLAISLLLLCVAGGDAGHALAGLEGRGLGPAVLTTDALCDASDSAPPHDATSCLLCRAARVSRVILSTSAAHAPAVARVCSVTSPPEALVPPTPWCRAETSRAPPARLAV